ncbi:hypothetical protein [Coraliomargarita sinensis]|nr:hypothetical protein [Coraliomargarita sinensis]
MNTDLLAEEMQKVDAPSFYGEILELEVATDSLALVVDVSSSMRPFLPTIRSELREQTPRNPTLHVNGCGVEKPDPRPQIVDGVAPETITAIDTLATVTTAKAILWITDMADPPNVAGVESLKEVLRRYGLQLYLICVTNGPPPSIEKLLVDMEGHWVVLEPKNLR